MVNVNINVLSLIVINHLTDQMYLKSILKMSIEKKKKYVKNVKKSLTVDTFLKNI